MRAGNCQERVRVIALAYNLSSLGAMGQFFCPHASAERGGYDGLVCVNGDDFFDST